MFREKSLYSVLSKRTILPPFTCAFQFFPGVQPAFSFLYHLPFYYFLEIKSLVVAHEPHQRGPAQCVKQLTHWKSGRYSHEVLNPVLRREVETGRLPFRWHTGGL